MAKLGIKDFGSHSENPFELEGIKEVNRRAIGKLTVDPSTGEYYDLVPVVSADKIEKDTREYRKVYVDSIPTIKNFSVAALKVWTFILMNLKINSDEVVCELAIMKKFTGYKSNLDIYKGLIELLNTKFIARKQGYKSVYYINSNKMFNGNRLR